MRVTSIWGIGLKERENYFKPKKESEGRLKKEGRLTTTPNKCIFKLQFLSYCTQFSNATTVATPIQMIRTIRCTRPTRSLWPIQVLTRTACLICDGSRPRNALGPDTASRSLLCLWHL